MRHHSAGVSSNLIQEALQGRRGVAGGLEENWGAEVGVGERGGITHKSLGLAYPELGQPESAGGGQIITPCWLLPQI